MSDTFDPALIDEMVRLARDLEFPKLASYSIVRGPGVVRVYADGGLRLEMSAEEWDKLSYIPMPEKAERPARLTWRPPVKRERWTRSVGGQHR